MKRAALVAGMLAGIVLSIAAGLAGAVLLSFAALLIAMVLTAAWIESHPSGPSALLSDDRDD